MIIIWLIFWLAEDTPALEQWNSWLISLIVCIIIDGMSGKSAL